VFSTQAFKTKEKVVKKIAILSVMVSALAAFACQSKNTTPKENAGQQAVAPAGYYTCSMHPQVHQKDPGNCPLCGMTLVLKKEAPDTAQTDTMHMAK
jgi:Cu(I)/Ag(I) efflux system membrane fusion protein